MDLEEDVAKFIQQEISLEHQARIVVAVSGGADSLCLLDILIRLQYRVLPAHFNHNLRETSGEDSLRLMKFVRSQYDMNLIPGEGNVSRLASDGYSIEEAGRILRYHFLLRVAIENNAAWIATGHTLDDQAETILMHLIRGTGLSGLRGMRPTTQLSDWAFLDSAAGIRLCRPLLKTTAHETRRYTAKRGFTLIEDESNRDLGFLRNRLRLELVPILKSYNPRVLQAIDRTAHIAADAVDHIQASVEQAWPSVVDVNDEKRYLIIRRPFLTLDDAIRAEVIVRAIGDLSTTGEGVTFETVGAILEFIEKGNGKIEKLPGGLRLERVGEKIELSSGSEYSIKSRYPQLSDGNSSTMLDERVELEEGWSIRVERGTLGPKGLAAVIQQNDPWLAVLRMTSLQSDEFIVRGPREGDRIQPLGMQGHIKISDLFINEGVPREARKTWPVIEHAGEIVWVVGLRQSELFKLLPEGGEALLIRSLKPEKVEEINE